MTPLNTMKWEPSAALLSHLEGLFLRLNLPLQGREYVMERIKSGPSRDVQSHRGNVLVKYTSPKTNATLVLESRKGEHATAIVLEQDTDVIAFLEQPPRVHLPITDSTERVLTTRPYTPDFLIIRQDHIAIREARDDTNLFERSMKNPHQFYRDQDGTWHFRAAELEFASMGLRYELVPNSALPSVLVGNVRFLEDYTGLECPPLDDTTASQIAAYVEDRRFVKLRALLDEGVFEADAIYKAVAAGLVHVDLTEDRLHSTDELVLFANQPSRAAYRLAMKASQDPVLPIPGTMHLRAGSKITYNNKTYTVALCGERDVEVLNEFNERECFPLGPILELHKANVLEATGFRPGLEAKELAHCSTDELSRALERLNAARGDTSIYSSRSASRFRSEIETAANDLEALIFLVDRTRDRGDRRPKISEVSEELAGKAIEDRFNTPEKGSKKGAYGKYVDLCTEKSIELNRAVKAMAYPTFCRKCDEYGSVLKREGKRSAYQKSPIVVSLDNQYPVHGVRPHEVCYIDHTIANLATVSDTGMDLGKPTLSVGVDGNTTHPRAFLLSYDPPSAKTVLLLLRDYVRRHQRLPSIISVDNGKEFHSRELEWFCRMYGIEIRYRAPGMPRGGAMIERLLGAIEEEVIGQMRGNTRQMKDPRLVTKSINPYPRAVHTLASAYDAVAAYLFEVRPKRKHPALGVTPDEFEAKRYAETGAREHRYVRYDSNLLLMTSPHAHRALHKVDRRRGIWVDGTWYRHPSMSDVKKGQKIEVRVEPWDARVVYACIGGKWVTAIGSNSRSLHGRTRREVEIAARKAKREAEKAANKDTLTLKSLRNKERWWTPEEFDPVLHEKQVAMKVLYEKLQMTNALPSGLSDQAPEVAKPGRERDDTSCTGTSADTSPAVPAAPAKARQESEDGRSKHAGALAAEAGLI